MLQDSEDGSVNFDIEEEEEDTDDDDKTIPLEEGDDKVVMLPNDGNNSGSDNEEEVDVTDATKDDNTNEDDTNRTNATSHNHRRIRLMQASGQTPAERRNLRMQQNQLRDHIAKSTADINIGKCREQNNHLWRKVRWTREAALDSLDLISDKASLQAEKMVTIPRYDAVKLAQKLVAKGSVQIANYNKHFNWRGFGLQVGCCFNALPSHVSFLHGPLDANYIPKERKKPERRKTQEDLIESDGEQPEDVIQTKKNRSELGAVSQHIMKDIKKALGQPYKEEMDGAIERAKEYESQLSDEFITENTNIDAVGCLFNPKSFTQTVENMFHFSFFVTDACAGIKSQCAEEAEKYGSMPGPVIRRVKEGNKKSVTQAIVSLSMKDWKDMCKAYQVKKSDLPHRLYKFDRESGRWVIDQRKRPEDSPVDSSIIGTDSVTVAQNEDSIVDSGMEEISPTPAIVAQPTSSQTASVTPEKRKPQEVSQSDSPYDNEPSKSSIGNSVERKLKPYKKRRRGVVNSCLQFLDPDLDGYKVKVQAKTRVIKEEGGEDTPKANKKRRRGSNSCSSLQHLDECKVPTITKATKKEGEKDEL